MLSDRPIPDFTLYPLNALRPEPGTDIAITHFQVFGGEVSVNNTDRLAPGQLRTMVLGGIGLAFEQTAELTGRTPKTVEGQTASALRRLDVHSIASGIGKLFAEQEFVVTEPATTPVRHLTPIEVAVLDNISQGVDKQSIADLLGITKRSTRKHSELIRNALGTSTQAAAVLAAYMIGDLPPK